MKHQQRQRNQQEKEVQDPRIKGTLVGITNYSLYLHSQHIQAFYAHGNTYLHA